MSASCLSVGPTALAAAWSLPGASCPRFRTVLSALLLVGLMWLPAAANGAAPGMIEGRVTNEATGATLELARVTVDGSLLETFTDSDGRYRLTNVPPGTPRVRVFYTGAAVAVQPVPLAPGATVQHDVALLPVRRAGGASTDAAAVRMEKFVVGDAREMSGTAIAINEQRFAPNMKSVVSTDEFGDVPDGNVAEFIKFLPGVSVNSAREISIDGVPSANVPISIGGFSVASPIGSGGTGGTGRANSMDMFTTSNLSRIEVAFSPTPESEGAALAGSVNLVPRSAFERTRPSLSLSTYVSLLNNGRDFGQESNFRKVHPGFDLSWVMPVNKRFGFVVSAGSSVRMTDTPVIQNVWRGANAATNGGTFPHTVPGQPYLSSFVTQATGRKAARNSAAITVDYKLSARDRIALGFQYSTFDVVLDHATLTVDTGRVLPGQFSLTSTRGAAGAGTLQLGTTSSFRHNWSYLPSLVWRHDGPVWKAEAGAAMARAANRSRTLTEGHFGGTTARRTNVTVTLTDVGYWRPGGVTVTDGTTGAPVDPFALSNYVVTAATGARQATDDIRHSAYANVRRDFSGPLPFALKTGVDFKRANRDGAGVSPSFTYVGPDRVASTTPVGSDDAALPFANPTHAERIAVNGFPRIRGLSSGALFAHYLANPGQFVAPNANTLYRSVVSQSDAAEELISSAYARGDLALFANRLKLVGGVRAEQTNIEASGPLTDPGRNIRRDAQGRPIPGADGRPQVIETDALRVSQLTFIERGTHVRKEYLRLFPSLNASYSVRENLILRAAAYTSVGRPDFNQYSGGITLPDLERPPSNTNRIVVNNAGIKAWSARTLNVRLEYYFAGLGQFSVGGFRRDFEDFFGATVLRATPEFLAVHGLEMDDYGAYDIATQHNVPGAVRMEGTTVNYKQALPFLPPWARGVQVFGNLTVQRATGDATANFAGYVPKTANWGLSVTRERASVHLNWNYRGRARRGAVATGNSIEPETFNWGARRLVTDVILEVRPWRRITLFANLRNLRHVSDELEIAGPNTPAVARLRQSAADFGSLWTIGVKGMF